jgi:hypothetical protein
MKNISLALCLLCAVSISLGQFNPGDRVQVVLTTNCLNVRSTPTVGDNILKCESVGMRGTVLAGPVAGSPYTFWQVGYDDGIVGWSSDTYLLKIAPASPADSNNIAIQLHGFKVVQVFGDSIIVVKER